MSILHISPILASLAILMLTVPLHQSRRSKVNSNKLFQALTRVINEEKIKQKIMRGLNLTSSQVIPLPGSPRDLLTRQKDAKPNPGQLDSKDQNQTLTVYSSTSNYAKPNDFSFRLNSRVRSIADDLLTAKLVLHFYDARSDKLSEKRIRRRRAKQRLRKTNCKTKETIFTGDKKPKRLGQTQKIMSPSFARSYDMVDTDRHLTMPNYNLKRFKKCSRNKRAGKKQNKMRIKIVVRSLLSGDKYKRRIAVEKIRVRRFGKTTLNFELPINLIKEAALSEDSTLRLQIMCKKCGRRVHLDHVMTTSPANDEIKTWLNPYRPYIFIEYREALGKSKERSRRALSKQCLKDSGYPFLKSQGDGDTDTCCSERSWVSFEELGLRNLILYPDGFYIDECSGTCPVTEVRKLEGVPSFVSSESPILSPHENFSDSPPFRNETKAENNHRARALNLGTSQSNTESFDFNVLKLSQRTKSEHSCGPLHTRPLLLWYVDPETNDITSKEIPDLIPESCGCIN